MDATDTLDESRSSPALRANRAKSGQGMGVLHS